MKIFILFLIAALLDTAIGNWYLPGKEGIVKGVDGEYRLYKYNRIFFIPIRMWDHDLGKVGAYKMCDFGSYPSSGLKNLKDIKQYLTESRRKAYIDGREFTEVYNTKHVQKPIIDFDQLLEGVTDPEERRVLESIQERYYK